MQSILDSFGIAKNNNGFGAKIKHKKIQRLEEIYQKAFLISHKSINSSCDFMFVVHTFCKSLMLKTRQGSMGLLPSLGVPFL